MHRSVPPTPPQSLGPLRALGLLRPLPPPTPSHPISSPCAQPLDPEKNSASSALKTGYYPGDLGFDPLGLKPSDPVEFREMQEKELSHCRLAMIAAAGFLAQEAVSDATWGTYWGAPEL